MTGEHRGSGGGDATFNPGAGGALEELVERLVDQAVQRRLQEALRDLPGSAPRYTSIARQARTSGVSVATLRRWVRAAGVQRQPNGKYLSAELEQAVAGAGVPLPRSPAAAPPADLAAARARRVAEQLLTRGRGNDR